MHANMALHTTCLCAGGWEPSTMTDRVANFASCMMYLHATRLPSTITTEPACCTHWMTTQGVHQLKHTYASMPFTGT